jgi:hypothetical protein
MTRRWLGIAAAVLVAGVVPGPAAAQPGRSGPYARIAVLRPRDGRTVDFEAGYIRHLEWHQRAGDPWVWYGWSVWAGERQRWFVYATFGHSIGSLDAPIAPADDEHDNILNVVPHAEFVGNALYEFVPALSRGTAIPQPTARAELTTVDLNPGAAAAFEAALGTRQSTLQGETLWYRMVAGGPAPRYVRLRPRPNLTLVLDGRSESALPDGAENLVSRTTVEILTLRPTMSLGLPAPARP